MKIREVTIEGIGGIKSLKLDLNEKMNVLCGPNGIGKTTVLEVISHAFSVGDTNILKRNVDSENSKILISITDDDDSQKEAKIEFDTFLPEKQTKISGGLTNHSSYILSLKTTRIFQYQPLQAVNKDTAKELHTLWSDARTGVQLGNIKNWFVNRYLYSAHDTLSEEQLSNFELAKACFSLLDENFTFSKVDAASNEIMINTPSGEIYYEYLSSGFKSIISIVFGIIKEIEFRFTEPRIKAENFKGVILIDEIELHLHPAWQGKVVDVLKKSFPNAQFITSTHSPHVIQAAQPNEIIALKEINNLVVQKNIPENSYGFQGWTIEEVLTDVMGMRDPRTELFNEKISAFQSAIDSNDEDSAKKLYKDLDILLHPNNHLRKLLKFQLISIDGNHD